jgi:predicted MPP superfamily phosphohydrolase
MPLSTHVGRRRFLMGLIGLASGTITGTAAWGYLYERYRLELTYSDVPVAHLPAALDGLRIALLTDVHHSSTVPASLVHEAVQLTRTARPDLIVLGGDYVTWGDRAYVDPVTEALAGLAAPHGVFAVLGNHDDDRAMPAALSRHYAVLRDARTRLTIRGERVDLVGLRFWTRKPPDVARVLRGAGGFPMLLAHDPRRIADAAAQNIPLVLSGHTHGGQVALPGLGALVTRKFPVAEGLLHRGDTTLFVSRGIGTVYLPVRINCPPEVSLLTLRGRRTA